MTMRLILHATIVILMVFYSMQLMNYKIIDWEIFETDENYIVMDYAMTTDENLFRVKGTSKRIIDAVFVRIVIFF